MIDEALVNRKFKLIQRDLRQVAKLASMPKPAFLGDEVHEIIAERLLERIIGRLIGINNHLIAAAGEPPAADYFESFVKLGELGVFSGARASELAQYAGLRNRLAHEYNNIDNEKVFERVRGVESDVRAYFRAVQRYARARRRG